jgi:hypothetical protein
VTYLAKFLGVPKSTAIRFKKKAIHDEYIHVEPVLQTTIHNLRNLKFLRKHGGEQTKNLICHKNSICEQMPDKIQSRIELGSRRKVKKVDPIKKHY